MYSAARCSECGWCGGGHAGRPGGGVVGVVDAGVGFGGHPDWGFAAEFVDEKAVALAVAAVRAAPVSVSSSRRRRWGRASHPGGLGEEEFFDVGVVVGGGCRLWRRLGVRGLRFRTA